MLSFKQTYLLFIPKPQIPKVQSCSLNQQELKIMKIDHPIKHFINQNFHSSF